MGAYIRRRLLQSIVVVWGVSVLVFVLLRLAPGDPATMLLSDTASPEQIAEARAKWGLDKPIAVQYMVFLSRAAHGDLGDSLFFQEPAVQVLLERMPATLQLSAAALLFQLGCRHSRGHALGAKARHRMGLSWHRDGNARPGDSALLAGYHVDPAFCCFIGMVPDLRPRRVWTILCCLQSHWDPYSWRWSPGWCAQACWMC